MKEISYRLTILDSNNITDFFSFTMDIKRNAIFKDFPQNCCIHYWFSFYSRLNINI